MADRSSQETHRYASSSRAADTLVQPGYLARIVATVVDSFVLVAVFAAVAFAGIRLAPNDPAAYASNAYVVVLTLLGALVLPFVLLGALDSLGGTPGKRLLKLQVLDASAHPVGMVRSTLRQMFKFITNLGLPFIFHYVDRLLFGQQGAHNVLTGSHVVRREAATGEISRYIQASEVRRAGTRRWGLNLVLGVFALLLFLVAVGTVQGIVRDQRDPGAAATRRAVSDIVRSAKPIMQLAQSHYARSGSFASSAADLGIDRLPKGIGALDFDARNGAITATLVSSTADARIQGKHLVWLPEFRQRKDVSELKKWRCGSPDMAENDRPFLCNDDRSALTLPAN